ncbi:MAG: ATP-binding protein [Cyanobacteriota bacterium]
MDIEKIIQQQENEKLEFKRELTSTFDKKSFLKDVCAFANTHGGLIIIGIENDAHKVIGIQENPLELDEKIANIIHDSFNSPVEYIARTCNYQDKILFCIEVYTGSLVPYCILSQGKPDGVYVRIGSTSRQASQEKIADLERRRLNISYDSIEVFDTTEEDLDFSLIDHYLKKRYEINKIPEVNIDSNFLESIKLLKRSGNQLVCTVASILLFGKNIQKYYSNSCIKCGLYKGNTSLEYIDKKEFTGSLFHQLDSAIKFFRINEKKGAVIKGLQREEKYIVPEIAIREALVNAIVHRNYSIMGSDIKFNIYDDYIEIINPGGLPYGMTMEFLGKGISKVRNIVIAKIFKEMGVIEEFGKGISKIIDSTLQEGLKTPKFENFEEFFKVTIYKTKDNQNIESQTELKQTDNKDLVDLKNRLQSMFLKYQLEDLEKVIEYLQRNNFIKNSECQKLLNINNEQAKYILNKLTEKDILIAEGTGKGRKYTLKGNLFL